MPSLKDDFNELLERIKQGRELGHASFEPIYYLIFSPSKIIDVKRQMPAWTARLKNEGWDVHNFSIAENIAEILSTAPLRKIWLAADSKAPTQWEKTNQSLANMLSNGSLQSRLDKKLSELEEKVNAILLVTDLEALHPYMRIGAIESQLQGKFNVTTVFLYPGERTGKTRLKFLGFYPEDGNYRSVHVGG
ncbi:MAG: BREX protein BrxB domain-containing protein [Spirochaetota bacterium]